MKADVMRIENDDVVMIHHNIGNLVPKEVDKYSKKLTGQLADIFGNGRVAFFPVREGNTWDFTIIKRPVKKRV